jgi:hypothetical protein
MIIFLVFPGAALWRPADPEPALGRHGQLLVHCQERLRQGHGGNLPISNQKTTGMHSPPQMISQISLKLGFFEISSSSTY